MIETSYRGAGERGVGVGGSWTGGECDLGALQLREVGSVWKGEQLSRGEWERLSRGILRRQPCHCRVSGG